MKHTTNLIIGAGPAGLAMAGRLKNANEDFIIVEQSDKVCNAWHNHYDRLHLHTVKQLSSLPHMDFPEDYPTYVSKNLLIKYFNEYIKKFDINPHFNTEVKNITQKEEKWEVETSKENYLADHVIISTGVNRTINVPNWEGKDNFPGDIIHSRFYKNAAPYKGKKVLVVGMGNTGAEVSLDLSENDVDSHIAVRGEIGLVPRDINGQPVQLTAKKLAKIPFGIGDWLGTVIRKVIIGDVAKYGLRITKMHPTVQLRQTGKTPVIDIGTIKAIKEEKIKVHPGLQSFEGSKVNFVDGTSESFDSIILATGYKANIQDFLNEMSGLLDKNGLPTEKIGIGKRKGLYFLGFDNYKLGGILGTIQDDSLLILNDIKS